MTSLCALIATLPGLQPCSVAALLNLIFLNMPRTDHDTLSTSCRINQKWLVCFSSLKQKFQGKDESSSETQALQEFSSV